MEIVSLAVTFNPASRQPMRHQHLHRGVSTDDTAFRNIVASSCRMCCLQTLIGIRSAQLAFSTHVTFPSHIQMACSELQSSGVCLQSLINMHPHEQAEDWQKVTPEHSRKPCSLHNNSSLCCQCALMQQSEALESTMVNQLQPDC